MICLLGEEKKRGGEGVEDKKRPNCFAALK